MATPKEKLNEMVNNLNEKHLAEVLDFVEFLNNKEDKEFWDNLPEDDEPLTEEDLQAIRAGKEDILKGETLSFEEVFGNNE